MRGYKRLFFSVARFFSGTVSSPLLTALTSQRLILPFYHIVSDKEVAHVKHLYPYRNTQQFSKDLDFFLTHYIPLDHTGLKEFSEGRREDGKKYFFLSFDDGLREFYEIAAPILKEKGVPAVCFLNSGFVDNRDLFYKYKASLLIERIPQVAGDKSVLSWFAAHRMNIKNANTELLNIPYSRRDLLDELLLLLHVDYREYLASEQPYLTTPQIHTLIAQGFSFGGHSTTHPEYRFLPLGQQLDETLQSMKFVTSSFALCYKLFAFPFTDDGVTSDFFRAVMEEKKIVDMSFGCAGIKHDSVKNNFQRIPMEKYAGTAKEIINSELLYYLAKMPFGRNTIRR